MANGDLQENMQSSDARDAVASKILSSIEALAVELNPRFQQRVTQDSNLQRDIGLDSLSLAELLHRTERQFRIRLPDDLIGRVETARDLIEEVLSESSVIPLDISKEVRWREQADISLLPENEITVGGVLDWHVRHNAKRPHILLSDGYQETEKITYQDLAQMSGLLASGLREWGLEPGERVGIMLPTGRDFFQAFFGVLKAGGVPVPMYPPMRLSQLEEHLRRQAGILRNSRAALLLLPEEGRQLSTLLGGQIETLRGTSTVSDLLKPEKGEFSVRREPTDLAMIQYTSGSTGDPKGVMLTHANLLSNIRAMGSAIDATSQDVFVSWLPLYHDLGLIGAWLGSLYYAVPAIILSPLRFIVRPESWLWAIHRNRATLTAAPNFAFEYCLNQIDESSLDGLDLSSLRMVANGAEPVNAETIRKFADRFEKYGFKREAMTPVYGLAENAVGLAFSDFAEAPIVERVSRGALTENGKADLSEGEDLHAISFVSSGTPLPGHEIRILDEMGRELPERHQGRLEFRGPSATTGYYRQPEKSAALFRGDWLDSGDLAYIANGHVFITGRIKDIIIKGGRNVYPEEIEAAVGEIDGIRKGCVAAFAATDQRTGSEKLVLVAETRSTDEEICANLRQAAAETVTDVIGMPADEIVIAPPRAILKTSSGKIRRSTTRAAYEQGILGKPGRSLWLQVLRLQLSSARTFVKRLFKSATATLYAGWWWTVIVLLGAVVWFGVLVLPSRTSRWKLMRSASHMALKLLGISLEIDGAENLTQDAGVITVNHSSYIDSLVLSAVLPGEPKFVAKRELAGQLVAGPFLRKLGVEFVDRSEFEAGLEDVEAFKERVRANDQLVIYPEATFDRMPGFLPFRLGAFVIACTVNTPVLPIVLKGTRSVLRGGQWFPRRGKIGISVLQAIAPEGNDFQAALDLKEKVRSKMLAVSGEPDMTKLEVVVRVPETSTKTGRSKK